MKSGPAKAPQGWTASRRRPKKGVERTPADEPSGSSHVPCSRIVLPIVSGRDNPETANAARPETDVPAAARSWANTRAGLVLRQAGRHRAPRRATRRDWREQFRLKTCREADATCAHMRHYSPRSHDAYIRGARALFDSVVERLPAPKVREIEEWFSDLESWQGLGDPPDPPFAWPLS